MMLYNASGGTEREWGVLRGWLVVTVFGASGIKTEAFFHLCDPCVKSHALDAGPLLLRLSLRPEELIRGHESSGDGAIGRACTSGSARCNSTSTSASTRPGVVTVTAFIGAGIAA